MNLLSHPSIQSFIQETFTKYQGTNSGDSDLFSSLSLLWRAHIITGNKNSNNIYVALTAKRKKTWITCYFCCCLAKACFRQKREFVKLERVKVVSWQTDIKRAGGRCFVIRTHRRFEASMGPELSVNSGAWKVVRAFGWNQVGIRIRSFTDCWIWATA